MRNSKLIVKNKIIKEAKEQFLLYGFRDASLRKIAKKAGISVSNLYNYFKNKDEIFCFLLKSLCADVDLAFTYANDETIWQREESWTFEWTRKKYDIFKDFIIKHRIELKMLLFLSAGSSLENYKNQIIDRYTEIQLRNIKKSKTFKPEINIEISEFMLHNFASFYVNVISELVMHEIPDDKLDEYIAEICTFNYYGMKALIKW